MGETGGIWVEESAGKRVFPALGIAILIVAVPVFAPLVAWGLFRSIVLCLGEEDGGPVGPYDPRHPFPPDPVCTHGDGWLYVGAPMLTFLIVGITAISFIVLYRRPLYLLIPVPLLAALFPVPYLWLVNATGEWW
jgi:hypothetical protein